MKINIIGLGYIGLPTALMLASKGLSVVGTDTDKTKVELLNNRQVTFEEQSLYDLYQNAVDNGIIFSTEKIPADMYIISVPTPYMKETKKIDAGYVVKAVEQVLEICEKGSIIVIESTVSPGTIDQFVRPIMEEKGFMTGQDIHIAHAPERIIPGNMIYELENNSRTIGVDDINIGDKVKSVYQAFCREK